jgi:hypothetical protein
MRDALPTHHFNLQQMGINDTGSLDSEAWLNEFPQGPASGGIAGMQGWVNVNRLLAGDAVVKASHFFTFAHGYPRGFGMRTGSGPGYLVNSSTLQQYGYWQTENVNVHFILPDGSDGGWSMVKYVSRRAGLTFCFIDGCNAAGFLDTLMINVMEGGNYRPTLQNLIAGGKFPYYGCGWTESKPYRSATGLDIYLDHADYVTSFFQYCLERDAAGYLKNTYSDSRKRAIFLSTQPRSKNPASTGWAHVGCDQLYMDE